jgi:hypothetical protein
MAKATRLAATRRLAGHKKYDITKSSSAMSGAVACFFYLDAR